MATSRFATTACIVSVVLMIVMFNEGKGFPDMLGVNPHGKEREQNSKSIRMPTSCRPEFRNVPNHTMCLFESPDVLDSGISMVTRNYIINEHNRIRGSVIPPATDLAYLVWDDRLAELAAKWASQCQQGSDHDRQIPNYGATIGQNGAWGYENWTGALDTWSREADIYRYGQKPESYLTENKTWEAIGHYTQMVYNTTVRIGCGFAKCRQVEGRKYSHYYFCNYAAGQDFRQDFPYTRGIRCSACPDSCVKGVCMCGGRICFNGGRLNLTSCSCECRPLYGGQDCKKVICPDKDPWFCGRKWSPEMCHQFSNVPQKCPHMCGKCPGGTPPESPVASPTQLPVNTEYVSAFGCRFTGARPSDEECKKLGDDGRDTDVCESRGGSDGCKHCQKLRDTRKACPVMCGLCEDITSDEDSHEVVTTEMPTEIPTKAPTQIPATAPTEIPTETTTREPPESCREEFRRSPGHTMCLHDNPNVIDFGVTEADKDVIIRAHNRIRSKADPPATDLPDLVWDDKLAEIAAKWARQCTIYHDKVRTVPSYGLAIGQNAAWGSLNWKSAINVWYEEVKKYRYGENPEEYLPEGYLEIGHYTQIVYNTTVRIGCGFASCQMPHGIQAPYFICNYAPGQGLRQDTPYINGTQCSACPDNCEDGLCRCGGKLCRNHGVLNVTSCQCECQPVYGGEECHLVFCPPADDWVCGSQWVQSMCTKYANAPSLCPYMCGICPVNGTDSNATLTTDVTPSTLDVTSASYMTSAADKVVETTLSSTELMKSADPLVTPPTVMHTTVPTTKKVTFSSTTAEMPTTETSTQEQTTTSQPASTEPVTTVTTTQTSTVPPSTTRTTTPTSPTTDLTLAETSLAPTTTTTVAKTTSLIPTKTTETTTITQQTTTPIDKPISKTTPIASSTMLTTHVTTVSSTTPKVTTTTTAAAPSTIVKTTKSVTTTTERQIIKCPFLGAKENRETCLGYGNWGQDRGDCLSRGGPWGCEQCEADPAFARGFCPVMCGICEALCDGLVCEHGGTLDIEKCQCHCSKYFSGNRCQTVNCPKQDPWYCGIHPPVDYCHIEPFRQSTRQECPYMCQIC